jgi:aspartyl-tRNA(Asn)/glutamyl-tRNA(Gln) amidotransferase subunit A
MDLNWLTIVEAHQGLVEKKFSAEELTRACLDHIAKTDGKEGLNNFITLTEGLAIEQASAVDAKITAGEEIGVLAGIPASIKDLFNTKGVLTSSASRMLSTYISPYESTATQHLKDAGYVLLGKANMDDCACGVTTSTSYYGTSLNPWSKDHVAGGSSGGSGSSVAAGQALFSLGTDTGGSIRNPAAWSGCVGFKPTYGRVSRYGVNAMASSWDHVGPLTRTVQDAALVLQAIAGHDRFDATTPKVDVPDYSANLQKGVDGLRIGIPKEYFAEGVDEEIRSAVMETIRFYESKGATVHEVSLPMTKYAIALYYIATPAELSTNLARLDGVRYGHKPEGVDTDDLIEYYKRSRGEGFGTEIKRRVMIGTFALSAGYADAYYKQAMKARTRVIQEFADVFKEVDVLMAPVAPSTAFKVGENDDDPLAMYLADALTIPADAAGIPAIALPCGFSSAGLPIGFQIMAPQWGEQLLFQVASAYEQAHEWHKKHPSF